MPSVPPHVNLPRVTIDCRHPDVNNHVLELKVYDYYRQVKPCEACILKGLGRGNLSTLREKEP